MKCITADVFAELFPTGVREARSTHATPPPVFESLRHRQAEFRTGEGLPHEASLTAISVKRHSF